MNLVLFSPPGNDFVHISAGFKSVLIYVVLHSDLATPSLTKWNATEDDFFFSVECGMVVLAKTDWLSPNI